MIFSKYLPVFLLLGGTFGQVSRVHADLALDLKQAATAEQIQLTPAERQQIQQLQLTAAMVWHGSSPWVSAVTAGATDEFTAMGVKVLAVTDAQFDPAKQASDIENISMLKPDFILSLVVDAASVKGSYQKAVDAGARLVLLSNPIPGFVLNQHYAGIVTDDMVGMGRQAAKALASHFENRTKPAKIGMIFHDASYFITNNRDQAFRQELALHSQLQLVAEKGFVREQETADVAAALILQQPQLDAIYVSWDAAAEGVIEALRAAGRADIKVITHDLGVNNLLDLARRGNMLATIADQPYLIGQTMARQAALGELGRQLPAFTLVPFTTVQSDNIAASWRQSFRSPLPAMLQTVLQP
ncbi:MAG: substrate-binding domain-containing protein [Gammaproteobacteria bacterium]|nr:substrate-binding domain-containing protein [Gammaproteobacteria bacterium]